MIKKFQIILLIVVSILGCKSKSKEIKADLSSAFIGKFSAILAHGDAQYPRLTQESWQVEVYRLNETDVDLDVKIQLQERVDAFSPFVNTGLPDVINFKQGKVAPGDKSLSIKREKVYLGVEKSNVGISMRGRKRDADVLLLEVQYNYDDPGTTKSFTLLLDKK